MGKRSNFERKERDFYATPEHAVQPLTDYLLTNEPWINDSYYEPCAGDGALIRHLHKLIPNMWVHTAFDIEPQDEDGNILVDNALTFDYPKESLIITNPPWDRTLLHPMIERFIQHGCYAWLLFDADWMHTKQSQPYMDYCRTVVSIGRVKWFNDKAGKDNACWYEFVPTKTSTTFVGRKDNKQCDLFTT